MFGKIHDEVLTFATEADAVIVTTPNTSESKVELTMIETP